MLYKELDSKQIQQWSFDKKAQIQQLLSDQGIVFIENINDSQDFLKEVCSLGEILFHHDSMENGLTHIVNNPYSNKRQDAAILNHLGLTQGALIPHTDRSGLAAPPTILAFWIESQSHNGGSSLFVDSHQVFEELSIFNPEIIEILSRPKSVVFKSENGLLESSIFEINNETLYVRFRFDKMVYFSTEVWQVIPELLNMIKKCTIKQKLVSGSGYILNNRRWLHGRTHFFGERSAYRLLLK